MVCRSWLFIRVVDDMSEVCWVQVVMLLLQTVETDAARGDRYRITYGVQYEYPWSCSILNYHSFNTTKCYGLFSFKHSGHVYIWIEMISFWWLLEFLNWWLAWNSIYNAPWRVIWELKFSKTVESRFIFRQEQMFLQGDREEGLITL